MNKDFIVNKWIPALLSGEYKQGRSRLRGTDDTYCCLGVACDIVIKEGLVPDIKWTNETFMFSYVAGTEDDIAEGEAQESYLPEEVAQYIGINGSGSFEKVVNEISDQLDNIETYANNFHSMIYLIDQEQAIDASLVALNDEAGYDFEKIANVLKAMVAAEEAKAQETAPA